MFGWYVWIIIALNRGMPLAAWSSLGPDRAPYPENTSPRCLDAHGTGRNVPVVIAEKVEWSAYIFNFDSVEDIFTNGLPLSGPIFDDDVAGHRFGGQFQQNVNASGGDIRNENVPEAGFHKRPQASSDKRAAKRDAFVDLLRVFFLPGLASLEADVCRELGIRLVDGLGEKVQSSWGTQGSMPSMHSGLQESRGRAAALFYHMSSSFWAHDFPNTTPSWDK